MATDYLFPCVECKQSFNVEVSQAGRVVRCPFCTKEVELPKLSQIRKLKPANEGESTGYHYQPRAKMALAQTWMFILGLPIVLIGLAAGIYHYNKALTWEKDLKKYDPEKQYQVIEARVDSASADMLWELWHTEEGILEQPPAEWKQSGVLLEAQNIRARKLMAYVFFAISFLGLVLCGVALATGIKKQQ